MINGLGLATPPTNARNTIQSGLGGRAHICAFFRDAAEQDSVLIPFMQAGLAAGEKIVYTIDPTQRDERIGRLDAARIDLITAHQQSCFELHAWSDTHLSEGGFNPDKTLEFFAEIARNSSRQGFPLTRFVTHMEWALENEAAATDLLAYEAKANEIWMKQSGPINPVICAYDLTN